MDNGFKSLIQNWDGFGVVCHYDAPTGSWIYICLHDDTLGPCHGGTRMAVYPSPEEGLRDAMRLAEGMTAKWAGIGFDSGGGKAVLAVPEPLESADREGLLERYGRLVEALRGLFRTGEDLGTTTEDLLVVARTTQFVLGFDPETGEKVNPSPYTAHGVFSGIRVALAQTLGSNNLEGRTVLIQGTGNVGRELARLLAGAGAKVLVSDIDATRAEQVARELEAQTVPADKVYSTPCDVFAPCAIGGILNQKSIPSLNCRVIAGSANNQLEEPADAQRVADRGILYVPDYVVNAGGAVSFSLLARGERPGAELLARMDRIGKAVNEILREAKESQQTPEAAAAQRAQEILDRARDQRAHAAREAS